jgi:hypothetical protein
MKTITEIPIGLRSQTPLYRTQGRSTPFILKKCGFFPAEKARFIGCEANFLKKNEKALDLSLLKVYFVSKRLLSA